MHSGSRRFLRSLPVVAGLVIVTNLGFAEDDLLSPTREKLREAAVALESGDGSRPEHLLETGRHDEAYQLVPGLKEGSLEDQVLAARILLAVNELEKARPFIEDLIEEHLDETPVRRLAYRWWVVVDDLARVDEEQGKRGGEHASVPDLLATANLRTMLLDFDAAVLLYENALEKANDEADRADALHGLGVAFYRKRDFDRSFDYLKQALEISAPDPDLLMSLSNTLIRLGRTAESIDAAKLAVEIAPYHERAHYLLGNGYADRNYSELYAAFPESFADDPGRESLRLADLLWSRGDLSGAREAYRVLAEAQPDWADVFVRLGSLDFAERQYADARLQFMRALDICPEYGRAHNGMAKALEAQRLVVEVHRNAYESEFKAMEMPVVPGIEEFVLNWDSLSPRHQKRVALSVEPWERFIPVLVESGSTYYIKPLYELLSETPGQELLRDQRISYDSRLWDDVRGCGGYNTVTGIEDVERTILNRYNTVLHELTHQVHAVLSGDRKREIQELYRGMKEEDQAGRDPFLSRYAGGSVWEYFAEGANAYLSPRRDDYDTREIVQERLDEKDPVLRDLVVDLMTRADVDSCYPVAYSNRGDDLLGKGDAEGAIAAYRQAIDAAPDEETALGSLIFALQVAGETQEALRLADEQHGLQPQSAGLAIRYADALWSKGVGLVSAIRLLEEARSGVRQGEAYQIDLELGRLRWVNGDAEGSLEAYQAVLDYQADNPNGLWGVAAAHALAGEWEEAWTHYDEAVRHRTGVVELRVDYARDLLRAGKVDMAREQVEAALLLEPEEPNVLAMKAMVLFKDGEFDEARLRAEKALELGPWCDLARLALGRIHGELGNQSAAARAVEPVMTRLAQDAPPEYVYRPKSGWYDQVHTLPAVERTLLDRSSW